MAIKDESQREVKKPVIDLQGPNGNAFFLLGYASKLGEQLGMEQKEIDSILTLMKSEDYENLINVFDKYFGDYVDLQR